MKRVGLEGVRFHDLRHTAVALAIAQGAHPKAIQARMGHSSVQVTVDRYGHLFPELDANIADGLDVTFRASLTLLQGGAQDTPRTQMRRAGHKIGVNKGTKRTATVNAKIRSGLRKHPEAASGIEPLYRDLQSLA
jgi:hypothetical protein